MELSLPRVPANWPRIPPGPHNLTYSWAQTVPLTSHLANDRQRNTSRKSAQKSQPGFDPDANAGSAETDLRGWGGAWTRWRKVSPAETMRTAAARRKRRAGLKGANDHRNSQVEDRSGIKRQGSRRPVRTGQKHLPGARAAPLAKGCAHHVRPAVLLGQPFTAV
jgi:hypothetical protein